MVTNIGYLTIVALMLVQYGVILRTSCAQAALSLHPFSGSYFGISLLFRYLLYMDTRSR